MGGRGQEGVSDGREDGIVSVSSTALHCRITYSTLYILSPSPYLTNTFDLDVFFNLVK